MTGMICLRRTSVSPARDEYLFVPMESLEIGLGNKLIAPVLPGNDSTTIDGSNSTNFIFNIGSQGLGITTKGTLQQVPISSYPTLPGMTDVYLPGSTTSKPSSSIDGGTGATAFDLRDSILDFIADQANTNYGGFRFGYIGWNPSGTTTTGKEYVTMDGVKYRMFQGQARDFKSTEVPDGIAQFSFTLTFQVGSTT